MEFLHFWYSDSHNKKKMDELQGGFLKRLLQIPSLLIMTIFTMAFLAAELFALYGFSYYTSFLVGLSIILVVLVNVIFFFLLKNISLKPERCSMR